MLIEEYSKQTAWRAWDRVLACLPDLPGRTVLDLGCGIGDQASLLAARGARVIGLDQINELLAVAEAREIPNAQFRQCNLYGDLELAEPIDGIWCSFTAAYFPELADRLSAWTRHLRVGGWIALTEINDLFGHEPLSSETRRLLDAYADNSLRFGRYDFRMGSKLDAHLRQAGCNITRQMIVPDSELSPVGPASPEVISAWRDRFKRMTLLRSFCGPAFDKVRDEFLSCLAHPEHRSRAQVYFAVGEVARVRHDPPAGRALATQKSVTHREAVLERLRTSASG
jgi:SAM-dependent methyltransferase